MFQHVNAFSGFTLIEMNNSTLTTIQMTFFIPIKHKFWGLYSQYRLDYHHKWFIQLVLFLFSLMSFFNKLFNRSLC